MNNNNLHVLSSACIVAVLCMVVYAAYLILSPIVAMLVRLLEAI